MNGSQSHGPIHSQDARYSLRRTISRSRSALPAVRPARRSVGAQPDQPDLQASTTASVRYAGQLGGCGPRASWRRSHIQRLGQLDHPAVWSCAPEPRAPSPRKLAARADAGSKEGRGYQERARRPHHTMTRVALVTGANRGIGRKLTRQLALRGDAVVLTARDLYKAERAAAAPGREPVLARRLDVTDPASVEQVAADLNNRYGRLDVLVNNPAIHYDTWQRASTADLQVVREALEVTCSALGRPAPSCSRCCAPAATGASSMSPAKLAHGGHHRAGQGDVRVRHHRPRGVRARSEGWAWAVPTVAHPVPARELLGDPGRAAQGPASSGGYF